jgi:hypothetical protein
VTSQYTGVADLTVRSTKPAAPGDIVSVSSLIGAWTATVEFRRCAFYQHVVNVAWSQAANTRVACYLCSFYGQRGGNLY